jgi:putative ABC transport system permease protein
VIVLIAVGNGSSKAVQSRIESLGTNVLIVMGGGLRGGARASSTGSVSLTKADAEALQNRDLAPDVQSASPLVNASSVKLVFGSSSYEPSSVIGTTP